MSCTEITAGTFEKLDGDGTYILYTAPPTPDMGDATVADALSLQFYGSAIDPSLNGEDTGTFDLSQPADDNYATCSRCLLLYEDPSSSGVARKYFQSGGTLTIDAASDLLNGKISATLTDVTLVEVTIDDQYNSSPVSGGKCVHIASATVVVEPLVAPSEWVCDAGWYADGSCDCGCGAIDVDCADGALASCQYNDCQDNGGGVPVDGQNWLCSVPTEWTCAALAYADATCDCGCGVVDFDCTDGTAASCDNNNCTGTGVPVDGQNWLCSGSVPTGWTCGAALYGDGTTCDCGCGALDVDCTDSKAASCGKNNCTGTDVPAADQNWLCTSGVPAGWTCGAALYGDGTTCDCGCGVVDKDCTDGTAASCGKNNCTGTDVPVAAQNWLCTSSVPAGWTCGAALYGDGTCNCGCGVVDKDCTDAAVGSCASCADTGSCNTTQCPGKIDPTNNAVCTP